MSGVTFVDSLGVGPFPPHPTLSAEDGDGVGSQDLGGSLGEKYK